MQSPPERGREMMQSLPDPAVLIAYSLACFVLFVTPGPDMSLALAKTVSGGRRAGLAAMLGALAGCCGPHRPRGARPLGPAGGLGDGLHAPQGRRRALPPVARGRRRP